MSSSAAKRLLLLPESPMTIIASRDEEDSSFFQYGENPFPESLRPPWDIMARIGTPDLACAARKAR